MLVLRFVSGPVDTNAYIIGCEKTRQAVIIDPALESKPRLFEALKKHDLILVGVYLTHSHWDHIGDLSLVIDKQDVPVYVHRDDWDNVVKPGADGLSAHSLVIKGVQPEGELSDGQEISIGACKGKVIHTPGHSPGSVCLYFPNDNVLISGDTLFKRSIGRLDLPTGNPDKMWSSLKKLNALPGNTKVYPGHGEETTIAQEDWLGRAQEIFGN